MITLPTPLPRLKAHRDLSDSLHLHFGTRRNSIFSNRNLMNQLSTSRPPHSIRLDKSQHSHANTQVPSPRKSLAAAAIAAATGRPFAPPLSSSRSSSAISEQEAPSPSLDDADALFTSTSDLSTVPTQPDIAADLSVATEVPLTAEKSKRKKLPAAEKKRRQKAKLAALQAAEAGDAPQGDAQCPAIEHRDEELSSAAEMTPLLPTPASPATTVDSQPLHPEPEAVNAKPHKAKKSKKAFATIDSSAAPAFSDDSSQHASTSRRGSLAAKELSRDPSMASDRAASPAGSTGWTQVNPKPRAPKRASALQQQPQWAHDEIRNQQPAFVRPLTGAFGRMESSETVRDPTVFLFNNPGSRSVIDPATGRRVLTLQISLKPLPELRQLSHQHGFAEFQKRARSTRTRHQVVEMECHCSLPDERLQPERKNKFVDQEDMIFNVNLPGMSSSMPVYTPAGQAKRQRLAEQREAEVKQQQQQQQAEQEKSERDAAERATLEEMRQSMVDLSTGAAAAALPPQAIELPTSASDDASAQLMSAVLGQAIMSPAAIPSVEQQILAQSMRSQSAASHHPTPSTSFAPQDHGLLPPPPLPLPPPGQPFIGPDGLTYVVDPATGQPQPWAMQHHPMYAPMMDPHMFDPSMLEMPPPHYMPSHTPAFFAPPKHSSRLEIRPPPAGLSEKRSSFRPSSKASTPRPDSAMSGSSLDASQQTLSTIPGSYAHNGAVYFTPPTHGYLPMQQSSNQGFFPHPLQQHYSHQQQQQQQHHYQ